MATAESPATAGLRATAQHGPSRPAKTYDIFEGTAEIQQLVIARAISGMQIL
jgi:hypothetical protein